MEIIETIEYGGHFWLGVIFFGTLTAMFLVLTILIPFFANTREDGFDSDDAEFMVILLIAVFVFGTLTFNMYKTDVLVNYKAKITDYNEVYENGYEIVDREGEIYILEKTKK